MADQPRFVPPPCRLAGEVVGDYWFVGQRWFADGPDDQLQPVELDVWAVMVRDRVTDQVGMVCWTAPTRHNPLGIWSRCFASIGECRTFCLRVNALIGGVEILDVDIDAALGGVVHG